MKSPIIDRSTVIAITSDGKPAFEPSAFLTKYGGVTLSSYGPNHIFYSQGDAADSVFYIQSGNVQLSVVSKHGKEAVLAVLKEGDFCGEGCLVGQPLHMSTGMTMTRCVIARLQKAAVVRAIHEDLTFSEFLVMYLLTRTVRLREDLIDHLFNSSEKRLARILLLLANYGKEGRSETVITNVDQQTLARMVGTTRSRINFFMNKFRKFGFIEYNGRINVHSSLLSVVLDDQPLSALDGVDPRAV